MGHMKHTPEPWGVWNHDGDWTIEAMSKKAGCMVDIANASFSEQDARRIVACVNACRDIDMTVLEMPNYSVKSELDTLDAQIAGRLKAESQRDELLAALRALYGWQRAEVEHFGATTPDDFIIEMVEKALKNA